MDGLWMGGAARGGVVGVRLVGGGGDDDGGSRGIGMG